MKPALGRWFVLDIIYQNVSILEETGEKTQFQKVQNLTETYCKSDNTPWNICSK